MSALILTFIDSFSTVDSFSAFKSQHRRSKRRALMILKKTRHELSPFLRGKRVRKKSPTENKTICDQDSKKIISVYPSHSLRSLIRQLDHCVHAGGFYSLLVALKNDSMPLCYDSVG